jgi:hypothetical protein
VFSLHSGLASAVGSTRIMKSLHPWVISVAILSYQLLTAADAVCIVLVLDKSSLQWRTISRRVYLAVDRIICCRGHVYPTAFVGRGSPVDWR